VWSPLDAFLYNLMTTNVAVFFGLPFIAGTAFYYPVSSLVLAIGIAGAFCLAEAVVYAFLISSIPRNGGDYVFQSRLLSGAVGTTFAFSGVVIGGALWMGIAGWFASRIAVGPFLAILGQAVHSTALFRAGVWVMSTAGLIVLGLVAIAWSALVNVMGMRVYARLQRRLVAVGFMALSVLVGYFALTRLSVNVSTYRSILYRALDVGYRHQGQVGGWQAAKDLLPVVAFGLIYPGWVAFQAAEVRRVTELRVQLITVVGGKAATILFAIIVLPLPIRHVGEELFGASVYLAIHDPRSFWILAPRLFGLSGAPWLSWVILLSLAIAINTWFWIWVPNHTLAASRVMLSMSGDRLLPRWIGTLHGRYRTPTKAIATFSGFCCLVVGIYAFLGVWRLALDGTIINLLAFVVTCVGAALFPFLHRELYRDSTAAPFQLLRVPLITVAACTFVAFGGFLVWRYIAMDVLAARIGLFDTLAFLGILYAGVLGLYVLFKRYRFRHEGADIEVYYRDLGDGLGVGRR
jgi:amino acid transporter